LVQDHNGYFKIWVVYAIKNDNRSNPKGTYTKCDIQEDHKCAHINKKQLKMHLNISQWKY